MATKTKARFNPQRIAKQIAAAIIEASYSNGDYSDWQLNEKQEESVTKQIQKIIDRLKK